MENQILNGATRAEVFEYARDRYGIVSVRGPRSVPYGLKHKLEKESGNGT